MILNLFMLSCVVCSNVCILNCNKCICLQLLGWYTPCYFFIALISCGLGLHRFYPICSNQIKDKEEGGGPDIPPYPMEMDSMTMWEQDSIVVFGDKAVVGTPQRRSSRQAARNANKAMKSQLLAEGGSSKFWVGGTPKRQAISSPQAEEFESADAVCLLGSESESEDEDMCVVSNDEGPTPSPSNRISTNNWDEEQHTTLGMCATSLNRMSLGPDHDAVACVDAKNMKKKPIAKRNIKCRKHTTRERGPVQTYKWVLPCYDVNEVSKSRPGYKRDQVLAICATSKLCKYKNPDFKAFGVKTKISNCASWSRCVKHVENVHYLHDPKDVEEALANSKAHWNDLEDSKARL